MSASYPLSRIHSGVVKIFPRVDSTACSQSTAVLFVDCFSRPEVRSSEITLLKVRYFLDANWLDASTSLSQIASALCQGPHVKLTPHSRAYAADKKMVPLEAYGVRCMSMGFLMEDDAPAVWRGPMVSPMEKHFLLRSYPSDANKGQSAWKRALITRREHTNEVGTKTLAGHRLDELPKIPKFPKTTVDIAPALPVRGNKKHVGPKA